MKKILLMVSLCLSFTLLAGCGPIYQTHYSYQPPASMQARRCIVQCQQNQTQCSFACTAQNNQCERLAQQSAKFQYEAYVNQQETAGKPVTETVNDFFNDSQCQMQQSCQCHSQYNQCYQLCGGQVIQHKKCVAFCGKQND